MQSNKSPITTGSSDTLAGRSSRSGSSSRSKSAMTRDKQPLANTKNSVLYLEQNHVRFKAPSKSESVFFDECNREIISVTSGIVGSSDEPKSKTEVVVQCTDSINSERIVFLLPVEKRLLSIKLNPTGTVLAYHVERNIIEFVNVHKNPDPSGSQPRYSLDSRRYVQASRARNSKLIGFLWIGPMELVIVTDLSVEYYHVDTNRCRLKHVKLFQSTTNWFVYQPSVYYNTSDDTDDQSSFIDKYSILMVSTGSLGNTIQPYMFTNGQIVRLQRFDVEGSWHNDEKLELFERSVTIAHIYGHVRLLVLQHGSLNIKTKGAQIVIYTVDPESSVTTKTHTLDLDLGGRFAINVLDNLVITHNQPSKTSLIFDIMIESTEKSDCPRHYVSLMDSQSIRHLRTSEQTEVDIEMYSLNWVFFQPNFIVDAKLGIISTLKLDFPALQDSIQDNLSLLNFLAHRRQSEEMILRLCEQIVTESYASVTDPSRKLHTNALADVSSAFDIIGKIATSAPEFDSQKGDESRKTTHKNVPKPPRQATSGLGTGQYGAQLQQEDIQRGIFKPLETIINGNNHPASSQFVSSTLQEFIFVLRRQDKNVETCIYEQLLRCLMQARHYFQVVQMIHFGIFKDSKQLACMLLSLRNQYWPAAQLGLDMFDRLDCRLTGMVDAIDLNPASARTRSPSIVQVDQSVEVEVG